MRGRVGEGGGRVGEGGEEEEGWRKEGEGQEREWREWRIRRVGGREEEEAWWKEGEGLIAFEPFPVYVPAVESIRREISMKVKHEWEGGKGRRERGSKGKQEGGKERVRKREKGE